LSHFTSFRIPLLAGLLSISGLASAQAAVAPAVTLQPEFDVSTIKPNNTGSGSISVNTGIDTLRATNVQLKSLIEWAFNVKEDQIFGLPHWAEVSHYDIVAKVVDAEPEVLKNLTRQERATMMRHLLETRLQMKTHVEVRILPVFELMVAKSGSKLAVAPEGANLKSSRNSMHLDDAVMTLTATHDRMEDLAGILADQVHKPVVDRTGLTDSYDFQLKWQRDEMPGAPGDASLPTLYTALQEQLGLRLESGKAPVDVVIIDEIHEPTEN
jgi:bla regulator protein BlaR1